MNLTFVVATDGSETSEKSENYVIETLDPEQSTLELVTVLEDFDEAQFEAVDDDIDLDNVTGKRRREAERMLREKAERYESEGFTVHTDVRHGNPGEELCSVADEIEADGIFMGRGGHTKFGELFHGSVSHYVLLNANTTVIITPTENPEHEKQELTFYE